MWRPAVYYTERLKHGRLSTQEREPSIPRRDALSFYRYVIILLPRKKLRWQFTRWSGTVSGTSTDELLLHFALRQITLASLSRILARASSQSITLLITVNGPLGQGSHEGSTFLIVMQYPSLN